MLMKVAVTDAEECQRLRDKIKVEEHRARQLHGKVVHVEVVWCRSVGTFLSCMI